MLTKASINHIVIQSKVDNETVFSFDLQKSGRYKVLTDKANHPTQTVALDSSLFTKLVNEVDDKMLTAKSGKYDFPNKLGKTCDVVIAFRNDDNGDEQTLEFIYGMDSTKPPKTIVDLIQKAISIAQEAEI